MIHAGSRFLILSLFLSGFFVTSSDAGWFDDCPVHKGYPDAQPDLARPAVLGIDDLLIHLGTYLDPDSLSSWARTHRAGLKAAKIAYRVNLRREFAREFTKLRMLDLPQVTQAEVDALREAGVETSIQFPLNAFKISETPVTIGLYHAVMGRYPDLSEADAPLQPAERDAFRRRWIENPDLPLTHTTLAEDQVWVEKLNRKTRRHFRIPHESQLEYAIRGRVQESEGAWGGVTQTTYFWGNEGAEAQCRAWIAEQSGNQVHGVRERVPGAELKDVKNSFGLIYPVGNVFVRSVEGVIRGGAYCYGRWFTESSVRFRGAAGSRAPIIGLRLVEER
jgi:formylglycine-generating enzyme required for sulfatase activity